MKKEQILKAIKEHKKLYAVAAKDDEKILEYPELMDKIEHLYIMLNDDYENDMGVLCVVEGEKRFVPLVLLPATEYLIEDWSCVPYDVVPGIEIENLSFLVYDEVVNNENEQKLIEEYVTPEYAAFDYAERELCVITDRYYDWVSRREKILNEILAENEYDEYDNLCITPEQAEEYSADWEETIDRVYAEVERTYGVSRVEIVLDADLSFEALLDEYGIKIKEQIDEEEL